METPQEPQKGTMEEEWDGFVEHVREYGHFPDVLADYCKKYLHHQLQKAREEERERIKALKTCKRCTKCYRCTCQHYIQPTTCTSHNMRHTFETSHSELDQDISK